jgi:hypothetical protein
MKFSNITAFWLFAMTATLVLSTTAWTLGNAKLALGVTPATVVALALFLRNSLADAVETLAGILKK